MAFIKAEGERSEVISIERRVRQGCVLSPLMFNIYSEKIFRDALEEAAEAILRNGVRINNIHCAAGMAVMAARRSYDKNKLELNINKTRYMVISKFSVNATLLTPLNNQQIQRTPQYSYLSTMINEQRDHSLEIYYHI